MDIQPGAVEKEEIHYDVVDFDALDALESPAPIKEQESSENQAPEKVKEIPLEEKSDEDKDPLEEEASPAEDEKGEQEKKDDEDLKDVDKMRPKEEDAEFKTIKLKDGKDLVEVAQDATFKFKIDGEFVTPTVSDLVEYFQRNKAVDRRFEDANDLSQKAQSSIKKHEAQVAKVTQYATSFMNNIKEGHTRDALYDLCRITGQDAEEQWSAFQKIQKETAVKLQDMTEDDMEANSLREENEFFRRQNQKSETEKQTEEAKKAQRLSILESCNQWGILEDTYTRGENYVDHLVAQGKIEASKVTSGLKAEVGFDLATLDMIDKTMEKEFPEKRGNWDLYNEILKDTKERGLTMDDWTKIIRNAKNGTKKQERRAAIKRKVAQAKPTQPSATTPSQEDDTVDWDEI